MKKNNKSIGMIHEDSLSERIFTLILVCGSIPFTWILYVAVFNMCKVIFVLLLCVLLVILKNYLNKDKHRLYEKVLGLYLIIFGCGVAGCIVACIIDEIGRNSSNREEDYEISYELQNCLEENNNDYEECRRILSSRENYRGNDLN